MGPRLEVRRVPRLDQRVGHVAAVAVVPRGLPDLGDVGGVVGLRGAEGDHDQSHIATHSDSELRCDAGRVTERNVLGGELEPCGTDPMTGFFRDGCCSTGAEDRGSHTICAVVTEEFLAHQRSIGNDLTHADAGVLLPRPGARATGGA